MGHACRKLAKKLRRVRQEEQHEASFLSPFGPPVETQKLSDGPRVSNWTERMTIGDWQEAAAAYWRWIVRCCEQYEPEFVERARFRVGLGPVQVCCRHCSFPASVPSVPLGPEEPERLSHPLLVCLFELFDADDESEETGEAAIGLFKPNLPPEEIPLLVPDEDPLADVDDMARKSFVCPRCGFIQPLDACVDLSLDLPDFEEAGWDYNTFVRNLRRTSDGKGGH